MDDVAPLRDACRAFAKAPRIPISGTLSVSMPNGRLQMDLIFSDDIIALHIMDVFSKYSILARARSEYPQEAWDASLPSWRGSLAPPKVCIWTKGASGRTISGEICAWNAVSHWYFSVRAPIRGSRGDVMVLPGAFTIA